MASALVSLGDLQLASTENVQKPTSTSGLHSESNIVDLGQVHRDQVVVGWAAGKNVTVVNSDGSKTIVPSTIPVIFILNEPDFGKIATQ